MSGLAKKLSIRKHDNSAKSSSGGGHFKLSSLRGLQQPELSKKLYKLIKQQNQVVGAYETAGRESSAIASQISDWGESQDDESLSDISDKLAVLLSEIAEQEEAFSGNLEESRITLKSIRDVEKSVQPSRDHKTKIADEIQKLKYKEPESTKIPGLEQELVRAEAQNLVAEAQLTNVTRQKFKEAFDIHTAAVIERAEKQIILAKNARELLLLLDDSPIIPGQDRAPFKEEEQARQILNEAESGLRSWTPSHIDIPSQAHNIGDNAMPEISAMPETTGVAHSTAGSTAAPVSESGLTAEQQSEALAQAQATAQSQNSHVVA